MDRYSAPRPLARSPSLARSWGSKFQSIEPIDDLSSSSLCVMAIVRCWVLWPCCRGSRSAAMALRARDFVVSYLQEVAATLAPHLVVGEAKPRNMGFCDDLSLWPLLPWLWPPWRCALFLGCPTPSPCSCGNRFGNVIKAGARVLKPPRNP